jgi:hypothetical protein
VSTHRKEDRHRFPADKGHGSKKGNQRQEQQRISRWPLTVCAQQQDPDNQAQCNINGKIDAGRFLPKEKVKAPSRGR